MIRRQRGPTRHRLGAWLTVCACVSIVCAIPVEAAFLPATVVGPPIYEADLQHNIPNLSVRVGDQAYDAAFSRTYSDTGGVTRWGLPTSEVLEETEGTLTQYYQRGVMDWHRSDTCGGQYCFERRLAWDFFGGGLNGAPDYGFEPGIINPNPGEDNFPAFGHKVSDVSIEGVQVGFKRFFDMTGQSQAYGFPKTEARRDTFAPGTVYNPQTTPGFIRQYFQSAVLEFHEGDPEPVKLTLLGDDLRDLTYPDGAWKAFQSFRYASPLRDGEIYEVERVRTPRRVQAILGALSPVTQYCAATSWGPQTPRPVPPRPAKPYCGDADFQPASLGMKILAGDVVRTRPASPEPSLQALWEVVDAAGSVLYYIIMGPNSDQQSGSIRVLRGDIGVVGVPTRDFEFATPDGVLTVTGGPTTLFLLSVGTSTAGISSTSLKVLQGAVQGRVIGQTSTFMLDTRASTQPQEIILQARTTPGAPQPLGPLSPAETARVTYLRQLAPSLRQPVAPRALLRVQPDTLSLTTNAPRDVVQVGNAGGGSLTWSAASDVPWLSLTQSSGSIAAGQQDQAIGVSLNVARLPQQGSQDASGTITFTTPSAGVLTVSVSYKVIVPG